MCSSIGVLEEPPFNQKTEFEKDRSKERRDTLFSLRGNCYCAENLDYAGAYLMIWRAVLLHRLGIYNILHLLPKLLMIAR